MLLGRCTDFWNTLIRCRLGKEANANIQDRREVGSTMRLRSKKAPSVASNMQLEEEVISTW